MICQNINKMEINRVLKTIILYFLSFQVFAKEEIVFPVIKEAESTSTGFFFDAIISSFNLIFNLDASLFNVVITSLKVSFSSIIIASLIAIPIGIIVTLNKFIGKKILMIILNTLMALPTVVIGIILYGILNRRGLLGGIDLLYTQTAIIIGLCILILPIILNLTIAAIHSTDSRLADRCTLLGATQIQRIFIYISEARFALITGVITGFGRAIGEVGIAMMVGGNIEGHTRTMTTAIALETSKGSFEFALSLGVILLFIALLINIILYYFQQKEI
jgi:tungstate transport system permease protein|tara:strand:+ start:4038 stop:4865 length:828 start_codon:yes stop_codon:yes gene_type:complete